MHFVKGTAWTDKIPLWISLIKCWCMPFEDHEYIMFVMDNEVCKEERISNSKNGNYFKECWLFSVVKSDM